MAKTDAYMPLWIGDYLGDTMELSQSDHGAYLLLLMHYWRRGPIPNDRKIIYGITRCSNERHYKNATNILNKYFKLVTTQLADPLTAQWRHSRADQELLKASENRDKYRKRAEKAAKARWEDDACSIKQALLEECPSPSPPPLPLDTSKDLHTEGGWGGDSKPKNARVKKPSVPLVKIGSHFRAKQSQIDGLISEDGRAEFDSRVETINDYCAAKGTTYKDYPAAYRNFRKRDRERSRNGNGVARQMTKAEAELEYEKEVWKRFQARKMGAPKDERE